MMNMPRGPGHSRRNVLRLGLAAAFVPMAPAIIRAQADLPLGPIRIILPTAAGGQADTLGRSIAASSWSPAQAPAG